MARNGGRRTTSRVLAGTSTQYLSGPVPHVLRQSLIVLVCGPRGVGKSSVVRHMMQGATMVLRGEGLQAAATRAVRQKKWPADVLNAERLVIDGPSFLRRRPGVRRLLDWLLKQRVAAGHRTVVIEGTDDSAMLLVAAVPASTRVTLNLRYPKAPGRRRFILRECLAIGLEPEAAKDLSVDEPWTYLKVKRALRRQFRDRLSAEPPESPSR